MVTKTSPEKQGDKKKPVFRIISDERVYKAKSTPMFNAALKHAGIDGEYSPMSVKPEDLGQTVKNLLAENCAGANITIPYKETVIPHLDILSEGANIIQAVNTITFDNGQLKGYNTNAIGFMKALEEVGFQPADKSILVFGAGGAARAVVFILNWLQAKPIFIAARDHEKVEKITVNLGGAAISFDDLRSRKVSANLVVNATSVSTKEESPEMAELAQELQIDDCQWMVDLNYDRKENFWREFADKTGAQFMDGIPILAQQASKSFALWTRLQVPPDVFLSGM